QTLHEVVGERVVVVDDEQVLARAGEGVRPRGRRLGARTARSRLRHLEAHASPSVALSTPRLSAASLFCASRHSLAGSESATTPLPACRCIRPPVTTIVRNVSAMSMSPATET